MRLILNIIWLVLVWFWMALAYALAAVICFILIITIPFGVAALRIAPALGHVVTGVAPFGGEIVPT